MTEVGGKIYGIERRNRYIHSFVGYFNTSLSGKDSTKRKSVIIYNTQRTPSTNLTYQTFIMAHPNTAR